MKSPENVDLAGSPFAALQHREFRLLFGGLVATNMGMWMQQFAIGWLLVQLAVQEGNPALGGFYIGLRSLANVVPSLACGLFAGVLADRMDRRDLLIRTRVVYAVFAVILAVLVITDHVNIVVVMVCSAALTAAHSFDPPGRQAMLQSVVPLRDLLSAMGLSRASMQAAHTVGPLVAGLLIVPVGVGGVMLANAACGLASLGGLLPMRPHPPEPGARASSVLRSLREGTDYMRRDDLIRWTATLLFVFAVLGQSFNQLLPAIAVETLQVGAVELSWLVAAVGVGALAGAFFIAQLGAVGSRGLLLLGAMFAVGALLALLGLQREVLPTIVLLAVIGVIQQVFMGMQSLTLQLAAPDRLRGRVMGMQSMIMMSGGPLGVLALGTLGTFIGISNAILGAGVVVALIALIVALRVDVVRDLRGMEGSPEPRRVPPFVAETAESGED